MSDLISKKMNKQLKINTVFAFMASDGNIAPEEVRVMRNLCGEDVTDDLINKMLADLQAAGDAYFSNFLRSVTEAALSKADALEIMRVAVDTVLADNCIEYGEVRLLRRLRERLPQLTDDEIMDNDPRVDEYWFQPDINASRPHNIDYTHITLPKVILNA